MSHGSRCLRALATAALALTAANPGRATVCAVDDPPAATLLLPYFEVDLDNPAGFTTLFSVANADSQPALVNGTLWTDLGVATLSFPIYLTGYDVQTFNLRDLFSGTVPRTAALDQDPADLISPRGQFSADTAFPTCAGVLPPPPMSASLVAYLRAAHTGRPTPLASTPTCLGQSFPGNRARGYVTLDVVGGCSSTAQFPGDPGYFGVAGRALPRNVLFGDSFYVDPAENSARGGNLVRIEADPGRFHPGDTTFYGRHYQYQAVDDREPLPYTWSARFLNGGAFNGGTHLVVWRDPGLPSQALPCGVPQPWAPRTQLDEIVVFDEQETWAAPVSCPFLCPPTPPPADFPLVSQRVSLFELPVPFSFGWLWLQFPNGFFPPTWSQAWVGGEMTAGARFSISVGATALDSGCGAPDVAPPNRPGF
jgi:hypothetical protein